LPSQLTQPLRPNATISSGTLEALKWLAVVAMTIDHVDRFLLGGAHVAMMEIGRLAMPLFCFVLAYNLARPEALASGAAVRVLKRILIFAVPATLPYLELTLAPIGWLPLNIMFTLAAGTAFIILVERPTLGRQLAAIALFTIAGALVDFGWAGIGMYVCSWYLFRTKTVFWGATLLSFMLLSGSLQGTQWILAAVPVFVLGFFIRLKVPRWRNALYYYYPLHLAVIVVLKIMVFDNL
jgi:hypothetical protein